MKIQCACGAKYAFDATPEMLQNPVRFVCPSCGLDLSDHVNELVRREFAAQTPAAPPQAAEAPRLKIARDNPSPSAPVESAAPAQPAKEYCPKHMHALATHHCVVCDRPMCPECMKLFGYVCSPMCRSQAEAQNINVPVYAGQLGMAEARFNRKVGIVVSIIAVLAVVALGFWTWYAWFGSVPRPIFSVRFDDRVLFGESRPCGTNQIVFLHGGTLARYDIKSGNKIWSDEIVTKQQIAETVAREMQTQPMDEFEQKIPQSKIEQAVVQRMEGNLQLRAAGQNIWVSGQSWLRHYDWDTGKMLQEIPLAGRTDFVVRNDEFLVMGIGANKQALVTHINAATGESRVEQFSQPGAQDIPGMLEGASIDQVTGLPLTPGTEPMNPAKASAQAQNLSPAGRFVLPALLANSSEQERIAAELNDQNQTRPGTQPSPKPAPNAAGYFMLVPDQIGYVELAARVLESRIVTREAMKPAGPSVLNGNLNASQTAAVANETLNEMQRNRDGDTVQEDLSRYQVTLRRTDSGTAADWTGEVIGPPALFPLKTVNVLTAGTNVVVLDKANKKLWQAALTYNVAIRARGANGQASAFGDGPCVERDGILYVFDQAVLTAFDLATGNARWRLPSVGVVGLFFDDKGMLFVNTTTADPESIKYSRQIDITQKTEAVLLKIDPQTGRTLWSVKPGGFISYLSGKFIYTVQAVDPGDDNGSVTGIQLPAFMRIRRINPANGRVLWEYSQERAPLDVRFKDNAIQIVFKKEVLVLKYMSF